MTVYVRGDVSVSVYLFMSECGILLYTKSFEYYNSLTVNGVFDSGVYLLLENMIAFQTTQRRNINDSITHS